MMEFVVFYAWQSDRLPRFNKLLIRAALDLAAKRLSADKVLDTRVRIDSDTEGVLGHVPVTETILRKIAACDAFVPDLTFIAQTAEGKLVPNPNVLLEYGYALRAKSYSIMIPVMNTAYGHPSKLPFDMGHARYPVQFALSDNAKNAERRSSRSTLSAELEHILRLMIIADHANAERKTAIEARQEEARRFLAPELKRTIDRVLYIHSRAIPNFIMESVGKSGQTNDLQQDFIPFWPSLYPNAPEMREISATDATALSEFYDSLHQLAGFVNGWWEREGQLPVNIFNMILHYSEDSLRYSLSCIDKFHLDELYPPPFEAVGTMSYRIQRSIDMAEDARKHHIARHASGVTPAYPKRTSKS